MKKRDIITVPFKHTYRKRHGFCILLVKIGLFFKTIPLCTCRVGRLNSLHVVGGLFSAQPFFSPSNHSWRCSPECPMTLKCLSCVSIYNWLSWIFADDLLYLAEWLMAPVFHRSMSGSEHAISLLQLDIHTSVRARQQASHKDFVFFVVVCVLEQFSPDAIQQVQSVVLSLHCECNMRCLSSDARKDFHLSLYLLPIAEHISALRGQQFI